MDIGYVAVETFIPTKEYRDWSELFHIKEVISLDCALCPSVLDGNIDDDYLYFQRYSHYDDVLNNLDLLLSKVKDKKDAQILAVIREPKSDCINLLIDERFKFYGYDLIEDFTRISALTNCGGFEKAFLPKDISEYGLIREFEKARHIQSLLKSEYPDEDHADCTLWGIWKMEVSETP